PRNVLFIMSDQHQTRATGCYGNREVRTPNIDRLAAAGTRFDRAYCQAPVCVPSRGSMITGIYPHAHGARILRDPLPDDVRTAAHFFRARGYVTGAIGKMHFVDETRRHGFDHRLHEGDFLNTLTAEERQMLRRDQGSAESTAGRPSRLADRFFQDNYFAGETVKFLRANRDRPFCLWSSFFMPHTPLVPHARYFDLYSPVALALPKRGEHELQDGFSGHLIRARERGWYQQSEAELLESLRGYYGNISQMDACVGRVYETLRELGLEKNTVVVYTSDHGEMAGAHRMWTKHNMYEQSVNVPLIVSLPREIASGECRHEIIEQVDLFPTLADLCGFKPPREIAGRSFASLLRGRRYTPREFAYSEYYFCHNAFTRDDRYVGKTPILMVRTDRWKLNYLSWERCELFDVIADPGEFQNRIDDTANAGVVRELKRIAERMYVC
ncbi:MAG TPA: sulfatase-like hydrolase/transferase, partial [Bryobacteraceae bacterium]|nr:sulfatase-like hydrolase/transferase [Bryobacteraceae bacterium]